MTHHDEETPFFARFLETQDYPSVETGVKAGPGHGGGGGPPHITLKYPSDDEESGGGGV